jgi:hypothetical protein
MAIAPCRVGRSESLPIMMPISGEWDMGNGSRGLRYDDRKWCTRAS